MNKLLVLAGLFLSATAMAASIPSDLPDGKYTMECQSFSVEKYDPPAPGSSESVPKGTDSNGVTRRAHHQIGTSEYVSTGNTTTIKDVYSLKTGDLSIEAEEVTERTVTELGDNKFEESATVKSVTTDLNKDGSKGETTTENYSWKRTFAVQDNFEVNLTAKNGDEPETQGRGELLVTKNSDGSYTVTGYVREGYHRDRSDLGNGVYSPAKFVYQSTSVCHYTPSK